MDPQPPALPPGAREVAAADCRWSCPRVWIRRASWTSSDPPGLWGQARVVQSIDRYAAGLEQVGRPRHIDITRNAGLSTTAGDIAEAIDRRLSSGRARQVHHPTEATLRGVGRPGLLARAGKDVLVIDAQDLVADKKSLTALVEAISSGATTELPGSDNDEAATHPSQASIVLIGPDSARKSLREQDARFDRLWGERVALRADLPRTPTDAAPIVALLREVSRELQIGEVSLGAFAFLLEQLAGRPSRRYRIAVDMGLVRQVLLEARLARSDDERLRRADVESAWAELRWRGGTQEEGHRSRVRLRQLQIATDGSVVGVVNGLMVYGSGRTAYSIPGRITARVSVGRRGIVNIEREAKYSGRSFDKGVFQLNSWLSATFAPPSHPLAVSASLAFEQSYGKVDGDSATLAEAIALLSELSGLPARQDVAVTGAINQRGELIPVGSVSLKTMGWWRSCRDRGELTGEQGVLIPEASAPDLQLDKDVLADISAGRFHVWIAGTIAEATELVLGRAAGSALEPASGTVFGLTAARLRGMSDRLFPPRKPPARPRPKAPAVQAPASGNGDGEGA
jgi:predicted ATP-dependent protease